MNKILNLKNFSFFDPPIVEAEEVTNETKNQIKIDINLYPWNFESAYYDKIEILHVAEVVDSLPRFMEEIYRISKNETEISLKCFYFNSTQQHTLSNIKRTISEYSFLPFNRNWRVENKIQQQINCNFDFTYAYDIKDEWSFRSNEVKNFAIKHYSNVVDKIIVKLIKKL